MRKTNQLAISVFCVILAFLITFSMETTPAFAANQQVAITSGAANTHGACTATDCFNPQILNIGVGDTVTWTNDDTVSHTSTSGNPSDNQTGTVWDSSVLTSGRSYTSPPFNTAGTYHYFCQVHPWMTGEIIVGTTTGTQPISVPSSLPLSISTDKTTYSSGDTISVFGHVTNPIAGQLVMMRISDPLGNIMVVNQLTVDSNGNFQDKVSTSAPTWARNGMYTVFVQVGSSSVITAQAQFMFNSAPITPSPVTQGGDTLNVRITPTSGSSPLQVFYKAIFSSGNPMKNIVWNFGDGGSSSGLTVGEHTYQTAGTYTGTVDADAMDGTSYTQTFAVTVTGNMGSNANIVISSGAANTHGTCTETDCFNPNIFSINVGQSVTWYNADTVTHTATSGLPSDNRTGIIFDSSLMASGKTYASPPFQYAGTYNYFCQIHPWMTGEIIVGNGVSQPTSPPTYNPSSNMINVQTDKSSYNAGSTVTITASSSSVQAGQNVAILVTDPLSNVVASRTIQFNSQGDATLEVGLSPNAQAGTYQVTASASSNGNYLKGSTSFTSTSSSSTVTQSSGVSIVSVQSTNQLGNNVVTSYGRGTTAFAKVVVSSTSSQSVLITVNLVGSDGTSLGVGSIKTSLGTGTSEMVVSFYIPTSASVGSANIYADIYSDWPTNGGTPLTAESSSTVGIQ